MNQQAESRNYNQGLDFHRNGKLSQAVQAYKKALKINPKLADARNNLAGIYVEKGRFDDACQEYRKVLQLVPDHPVIRSNIGYVLFRQGKHAKAIEWLNKAIKLDSKMPMAYYNLASAQSALGEDSEAISILRQMIGIAPEKIEGYLKLGSILAETGQIDESVNYLKQALEISPENYKVYQGLARVYGIQGDLERAVQTYLKAVKIDTTNPAYHQSIGKLYSEHGEMEKALAAYRESLKIDPDYALAYQGLSVLTEFVEYDEDIKAMETLISRKEVSSIDSINLGFSLGKAFENLGDYKKAFKYISKATRLRRKTFKYSISQTQDQIDKIMELFSVDFFSERADCGLNDQAPVFILGMPRSGTSLVEQILASHPEVYGAGERDDLAIVFESIKKPVGRFTVDTFPDGISDIALEDFSDLGLQYMERIRRYADDSNFITDKMPHNFIRIGFIKLILPEAKIIHCTRNAMDCCLSIFKTNLINERHHYSYDMTELGQYYNCYLQLMDHWHKILPGSIYDINYESLVSDHRSQVEHLLQHCELPWDDNCLEFYKTKRKVETASKIQVNTPLYSGSVSMWKQYEKFLDPLKKALAEG